MDGNRAVAEFAAHTRWEGLPAAVQRRVRMHALDALGAALVGAPAAVSRITARFAARTWPGDEATILLQGRRASALGAAFANGYAANAVDIDDCALYTKGHPGAQILATALALAEGAKLSGARMLAAMVVGYEVAHRAARIWHATHEVYQACASWGSVACAAVAANLLGLPVGQTQEALGIADYYAPNVPMMRDIDHPAMVKHGIGWGAMTGIMAAQLAAEGFTGVPSLFGLPAYEGWVQDIGQHYILVDGVGYKEYACCAWAHAALDATRKLVAEHPLQVDDIASIRVTGFRETVRLGARLPATTEEAQFNVAWPLAALLVYGQVGPDQVRDEALKDARLRALAAKVELAESAEFTRLYDLRARGDPAGSYCAEVAITLADGRCFSSGTVASEMRFPQQWDEAKSEAKFRRLLGNRLDPARIDGLIHAVWHLAEIADVRDLTGLAQ